MTTQWIIDNKEWLFSGVGVAIIAAIIAVVRNRKHSSAPTTNDNMVINNNNTVNIGKADSSTDNSQLVDPSHLKACTHILFIDDDQKFKVVDILRKSGWTYTKRTSDVGSIDDPQIQLATILFIDIHGVGRRLQFKDEGLGLAAAIKNKYPEKKVVIYSSQTQGERFHESLRKADDFLPKNADPYEFQQLTERLALQLANHK